jgi:hypothetical protein
MCQVTVDVGVLFTASGLSHSHVSDECCMAMLAAMRSSCCTLVLDEGDQIKLHYARKMHFGHRGFEWAHEMGLAGRLTVVRRVAVSRADAAALGKIGFYVKNEDFKYYVRSAAASDDKVVVSLDPNFFNAAEVLRRCYGIKVFQPEGFIRLPLH